MTNIPPLAVITPLGGAPPFITASLHPWTHHMINLPPDLAQCKYRNWWVRSNHCNLVLQQPGNCRPLLRPRHMVRRYLIDSISTHPGQIRSDPSDPNLDQNHQNNQTMTTENYLHLGGMNGDKPCRTYIV